MPRGSPVRKPAAYRQSPGIPLLHRHSPGLYRHQIPAELRQRPDLTPVIACYTKAEPR
ncbi:hypothetical protein DPMN_006419 [Dreissena polymorpha]|uniref:Uncharacterized protein n=1 Tax=Dreissena polymorpha TaxID=45954 RepID=A0A9D4RVC9_DREPO|nr:hypothetical protein DPMN_006419 [Dreissena polymorpha]